MILVAAMLKAVDGKGDKLEREFQMLVPKVPNHSGTITYAVHRSIDDSSKFFVYDKYESPEALKTHSSIPHLQGFSQAMTSMLDGRPEVGLNRQIA